MATDVPSLSTTIHPLAPAKKVFGPSWSPNSITALWRRRLYWNAYWPLIRNTTASRPYIQLLRRTVHLEGDVVECGVFRGRSLLRMASLLAALAPRKTIYGLDSFDGFPTETITSGDLGPGRTMEKVRGRFRNAQWAPLRLEKLAQDVGLKIKLLPGYFEHSLPKLAGRRFCFVHLDCDIYESYRTCLEGLYDAVVPGGVILFDEYACSVWPGATRAVDEFFHDKPERIQRCEDPRRLEKPKYYVVKGQPTHNCQRHPIHNEPQWAFSASSPTSSMAPIRHGIGWSAPMFR